MKVIIFIWNNSIYVGEIISQVPSKFQGQKTEIKVYSIDRIPVDENTMQLCVYGKCEVGNCGPLNVLSIDKISIESSSVLDVSLN